MSYVDDEKQKHVGEHDEDSVLSDDALSEVLDEEDDDEAEEDDLAVSDFDEKAWE